MTGPIAPPPMLDANDDLSGQTLLGKLRVIRKIGEGGMGVVYEVEHLLTRHRRALKVLRPELSTSAEGVARLVREAGVAGRLRSPFVVETYDVGRLDDGSTYILMELLEGRSLRALLDEEGPLSGSRAARLVAEVCEGLQAVHAAGIIHRDLKPENLFLTAPEERMKILDFGIMKLEEGMLDTFGALTRQGSAACTPCYMAPEQTEEGVEIDRRADVYALGVVLYEALSGQRPFTAPTLAALAVRIHQGKYRALAEIAPGVDPGLEAVVRRAMSRERDARFATVADLRQALLPFVSEVRGAGISALVGPAAPRPKASWRGPVLAGALVLGASAILALVRGSARESVEVRAPVEALTALPPAASFSTAAPPSASSPASSAPSTQVAAPPRASRALSPKAAGPSCTPPFVLGEDGIQHMKPECL